MIWARGPVLLGSFLVLVATSKKQHHHRSEKYSSFSRYEKYPSYCSNLKNIEDRRISSPFKEIGKEKSNLQLIQVLTIIRHGSRVPLSFKRCWEGYLNDESDTSTWDCGSREYSEDDKRNKHGYIGSCKPGQLLKEGYKQVKEIGKLFRNAYILTEDKRMQIYRGLRTAYSEALSEPHTVVLADLGQRTIISAQGFMQGFFRQRINYSKDQISIQNNNTRDLLSPDEGNCPRLIQYRDEALSSNKFLERHASREMKTLPQMLRHELKSNVSNIRDCLMTTYCTDRTLPDQLNDYDGDDNESIFMKFINHETFIRYTQYLYNSSAYARTATGPLWYDIINKVRKTFELQDDDEIIENDQKYNRFVLYSAHDSTVMSMLSSLGSSFLDNSMRTWAEYASMIIIEIYADFSSDERFFRLLYNGEDVTGRVPGCEDADFCDVQILLGIVEPFATKYLLCD